MLSGPGDAQSSIGRVNYCYSKWRQGHTGPLVLKLRCPEAPKHRAGGRDDAAATSQHHIINTITPQYSRYHMLPSARFGVGVVNSIVQYIGNSIPRAVV